MQRSSEEGAIRPTYSIVLGSPKCGGDYKGRRDTVARLRMEGRRDAQRAEEGFRERETQELASARREAERRKRSANQECGCFRNYCSVDASGFLHGSQPVA